MRRSTQRKLKVYAVDAAMILLATQVTVVLKAANKAHLHIYQCRLFRMNIQEPDPIWK